MELSHAISDTVLTLTGLFVFFNFLKPLNSPMIWLWSTFILSITVAALFGAIRFWGYPPARSISEIFQHLAGTAGAIGLVMASYLLITTKKTIPQNYILGVMGLGVMLFVWVQISDNLTILKNTSMIAIPLVLLMGIWGLMKGKTVESAWLILGTTTLVIATFNKAIAVNIHLDSVDLYHYLLAISVLCLGKASTYVPATV